MCLGSIHLQSLNPRSQGGEEFEDLACSSDAFIYQLFDLDSLSSGVGVTIPSLPNSLGSVGTEEKVEEKVTCKP